MHERQHHAYVDVAQFGAVHDCIQELHIGDFPLSRLVFIIEKACMAIHGTS